jgi:hypothetical protein
MTDADVSASVQGPATSRGGNDVPDHGALVDEYESEDSLLG